MKAFLLQPNDEHLRTLAEEFCANHVAHEVDLNVGAWIVACEVDAFGNPTKAHGISNRMLRLDYPLWHFITPEAGEALLDRNRASLEEMGVARGTEVHIHIAKSNRHRCPKWKQFIRKVNASNANRWAVNF